MKTAVQFFDLPPEVRDMVYKELLVYPGTIYLGDAIFRWPWYRTLFPEIILSNKLIHREATAVLYGLNHFMINRAELFACFIDLIGPLNAELLRHVSIPFPGFHHDSDGSGIFLQHDSDGVRTLNLIYRKCPGIITLEASLDSIHSMNFHFDELESPQAEDQALDLVDKGFRAITSLQEVRIQVYDEPDNMALREKMASHGWIIGISNANDNQSWWIPIDDDYNANDHDYDGWNYGDDKHNYDQSRGNASRWGENEDWWDAYDEMDASG